MKTQTKTARAQRNLFHRVLIVVCLACSFAGAASANNDVYRKAINSTTFIVTDVASGSGVLIDRQNGLVVTNHHVIEGSETVVVFFPVELQDKLVQDKEYYLNHIQQHGIKAKVVAADATRDIAILQLPMVPKHAVEISVGLPAEPGDMVHSIGNPGTSGALWIYTNGYVRANYYKRVDSNRMQVVESSSPVNPGDSGGPMLNDEGQLVGLTQSFMKNGRLVSNGVDISEITWFVKKVEREQGLQVNSAGTPDQNASHNSAGQNLLSMLTSNK